MNKIFDMNRFGRYFATDLKSCIAGYGLSFLLISLMGLIIYIGTVMMGLIVNGTWVGPDLGFRVTTFGICMFVLIVTMPVKCYGKITDRKDGSDWLMIPVSGMEKFLSMVIMTIFIVPVASAGLYLGTDAILCALDSTCGDSMITSRLLDDFLKIAVASDNDMAAFPDMAAFIRQVRNPLLYIDDIIGGCLIFLLGAIVFQKSKSVKTFIAIIVITTALGMIVTPVINVVFSNLATTVNESPEALNDMFSLGIFRHVAIFDTINDTIVNLILLTGIYFRIKTLKH